jgi:hypothetical protein
MSTITTNEKDKYLNLSNITSIVSFSLLIGIVFVLVRFHFYYQVLLHVPIFQFVDASELLLMAPASAIIWIFYLGSMELGKFIRRSDDFTKFQKWVFQLTLVAFGWFYVWINYLNDPIVRQFIKWPWHYAYWYIWFPILMLFVVAFSSQDPQGPVFFKKNRFILPLVLTVWYGLFEGWANYEVVKKSKHTNAMTVKTKMFGVIRTDSVIINAGNTRNYWFYYNRNTHITTAIKKDDIEITEFDSENK